METKRMRSQDPCKSSSHVLCGDAEAMSVWHLSGGRVLLRFTVNFWWPGYWFLLYLHGRERDRSDLRSAWQISQELGRATLQLTSL